MSDETETTLPAVTELRGDLITARPPAIVLREAQQAAMALKEVIDAKPKKVRFNGETYLEFEDWQTCARFYGITVKVTETHPVDFDDVNGFQAHAVVLRSDGMEIGAADALCLDDEPNWARKPKFQLLSMAQTRACAKALRTVLAWVVVLAGYKPTPAEEMNGHHRDTDEPHEPPRQVKPAAANTGAVITEPQRKRLFAIAFQARHSTQQVHTWLKSQGIQSASHIPKSTYDALCERLKDPAPLTAPDSDEDFPEWEHEPGQAG